MNTFVHSVNPVNKPFAFKTKTTFDVYLLAEKQFGLKYLCAALSLGVACKLFFFLILHHLYYALILSLYRADFLGALTSF